MSRSLLRLKFTPLFLIVLLVANGYFGSLTGVLDLPDLESWGVSLDSLQRGEWFRLITGTYLSHDGQMVLRQLAFAGVVLGWYEWHRSAVRTALMFLFLDITGTLFLMFGLVWGLADFGPPAFGQIEFQFDVGMSAGGFGLLGASLRRLRLGWVLLGVGMALLLAKLIVYPDVIADLAHIVMLPFGFLIEHLVDRNTRVGPK